MSSSAEPARIDSLNGLTVSTRIKVETVLKALKARGYDPILFETGRTPARQRWLYGIGRSHDLGRKPVTWTMQSKHLTGEAADIISKRKGWDWPQFFTALAHEASKAGMHTIPQEECHIQCG